MAGFASVVWIGPHKRASEAKANEGDQQYHTYGAAHTLPS